MDKILTVIIPTYNMEKYLRKCLDSLIVSDENMQCLEVLIVNDGSKDSSSKIAHEYEAKFPQTFRVIDKENGNYGSCINRGLKEAIGTYVKVLDADDYFDNRIFNQFLTFLSEKEVDLIVNDYSIVDIEGNITETYTFPLPIKNDFSLSELPIETIMWLWHHGITYNRAIFQEFDYKQTEGISYTDDEWIFKPMVKVRRITYYPHNLYYYLMGREGQTFDPKILSRDFGTRFVVLKSMLDFYSASITSIPDEVRRYLTYKLYDRLISVYRYYLIQYSTKKGNVQLAEMDKFIRRISKELSDLIDSMHNRTGYYFVREWKQSNYNRNLPMLILLRLKHRFYCLIGKYKRNLHMKEDFKRHE